MSDKANIDLIIRTLERNGRLSRGLPVPIIRADTPAGYIVNPQNPQEVIVDVKLFNLLLQARKYLKESPYSEVSDWLTKNGLPISHNGLHKLMTNRPPYTEDERHTYRTTT